MEILEEVEKEEQLSARCEKSIALEKLKQRRTDTRHKIELGGLVIKSTLNIYNKSVILGALSHSKLLIEKNDKYLQIFESMGSEIFFKNKYIP